MAGPLKLRATDQDDLAVVATCLQDALVPIGDMTFLPEDRRFVIVANRFRWETGASIMDAPREADSAADAPYDSAAGPRFERINCGVWFDGVQAVRTMGVDLRDRSVILELLTLRQDGGRLQMVFAGGAVILLEIDGLRCFLEDIGEPWPTQWRPGHPAGTAEGPGE
jgi:hypothetical protein